MRNATILIVRLKGVATEAIKNIVLAGIGKLIIVDDELVAGKDLGAGFLFRDEDVGKKVSRKKRRCFCLFVHTSRELRRRLPVFLFCHIDVIQCVNSGSTLGHSRSRRGLGGERDR
jgi:hypothetical protein